MMDFPFGFGLLFTIVPVLVAAVFILVFVLVITSLVRRSRQYRKDAASPVLTVDAAVTAKRADVSTWHHGSDMNRMDHVSSSTAYYVTFQVPSGDRMELRVGDTEYGMLAQGDTGKLTFQGSRYLGFERARAR